MRIVRNGILVVSTLLMSGLSFGQANNECDEMEPICTDAGLNFTANSAGGSNVLVDEPGNNYSCLGFSPSPSWYYL